MERQAIQGAAGKQALLLERLHGLCHRPWGRRFEVLEGGIYGSDVAGVAVGGGDHRRRKVPCSFCLGSGDVAVVSCIPLLRDRPRANSKVATHLLFHACK